MKFLTLVILIITVSSMAKAKKPVNKLKIEVHKLDNVGIFDSKGKKIESKVQRILQESAQVSTKKHQFEVIVQSSNSLNDVPSEKVKIKIYTMFQQMKNMLKWTT